MIGERIAHYEITGAIGAGGMGEVYRARDTKLGRDVALKLIPDLFASDPGRMARFQREAQLLAALNHANIAAIYGVEESEGRRALVLELVEGEDLAQRLRAGPVPVDEALDFARQIAEAFEAAHDRGVVHRDLKPANVKITPDGTVKVLDFGLAKALEGDVGPGGDPSLSLSPTLTVAASREGFVMGTAAYMSPEQAKGKTVDRRADIWSFGVVLFEMLAGKRMFSGETVSETLAAVIKDEPDFARLPDDTPPAAVELLRRCLEKDPRRRLQSVGEARIAIENIQRPESFSTRAMPAAGGAETMEMPAVAGRRGPRPVVWLALLAVAAAVAGVTGYRLGGASSPAAPTRRFAIEHEDLRTGSGFPPVLSPDGSRIAFRAGETLWIRSLDDLEAREVTGSDGGAELFWSPDGASLGFVDGSILKRVDVATGRMTVITELPFNRLASAGWAEDDTIYLSPPTGAIHTVPAQGGEARPFLEPVEGVETDFHDLFPLPGGRGLLFSTHRTEGVDTIEVLADGERKVILRVEGARLGFVRYTDGHIVYERRQTNSGVWAAPFSPSKLELTGEPFLVDPDGSYPSVSEDGGLLYAHGASSGLTQLGWVDRSGNVGGTAGETLTGIRSPHLSPDGGEVLFSFEDDGNRDVWVLDLERETRTRITFGEEDHGAGDWLPSGDRIVTRSGGFSSFRSVVRSVDGTGEPVPLVDGASVDVGDDATWVVYMTPLRPGTGADLYAKRLDGEMEPEPFVVTEHAEIQPALSPDGRHAAYASNESGEWQVYLKRFPGGEGKWQVSVETGRAPVWSRDGRELFWSAETGMYSASVETEPRVRLGKPVRLFGPAELPAFEWSRDRTLYDVSLDGERFLMVLGTGDPEASRTRLVLTLNWR